MISFRQFLIEAKKSHEEYISSLSALHGHFREDAKKIPAEETDDKFVAYHDHMAHHYAKLAKEASE